MTDQQATPAQPVTQNATTRYLKKESLQKLLERLFPGQTDFKIRLKEDQWSFTAPTVVKEGPSWAAMTLGTPGAMTDHVAFSGIRDD
ncbi:uncharacterized protein PG986_007349 [Apiospora aurea]|uniref:Uncharacterized protein n=1 Tax=Apiospora aurea TaxID=335848 RepID=A0ABR1QCB8_9PEZI